MRTGGRFSDQERAKSELDEVAVREEARRGAESARRIAGWGVGDADEAKGKKGEGYGTEHGSRGF